MKDTHLDIGQVSVDKIVDSEIEKVYVECRPQDALIPPGAMRGSFEGSPAQSIAVIEDDSDYQDLINRDDTEVLALPTDKHLRREILASGLRRRQRKTRPA